MNTFYDRTNTTKLLGHRGARGEAPENTLAGFAYLQKLRVASNKVDGVEFDVQLTQNGKLAVHHDDTLIRTCGLPIRLNELDSKYLSKINQSKLGNKFDKKLAPQPNSLLEDVIPYLANYTHIELEIKTHNRTHHNQLTHALIKELSKNQYLNLPIIITSFDIRLLEQLQLRRLSLKKSQRNDTPLACGLLIENYEFIKNPYNLVNLAKRLQVVQVGIFQAFITQYLVDLLHHYGLKVTAWTVNDFSRAKQLQTWGVNNIITDYPAQFICKGI